MSDKVLSKTLPILDSILKTSDNWLVSMKNSGINYMGLDSIQFKRAVDMYYITITNDLKGYELYSRSDFKYDFVDFCKSNNHDIRNGSDLIDEPVDEIVETGCEFDIDKFNNIHDTKPKPKPRKKYPKGTLTNIQIEVLELITRGYTTSYIAKKRGVVSRTIEGHRNLIIYNLEAKNITHATVIAIRSGIIKI